MFYVLARSREGMICTGDRWLTRFMWCTWAVYDTIEEAAEKALQIALGGNKARVVTKDEYCRLPDTYFRPSVYN